MATAARVLHAALDPDLVADDGVGVARDLARGVLQRGGRRVVGGVLGQRGGVAVVGAGACGAGFAPGCMMGIAPGGTVGCATAGCATVGCATVGCATVGCVTVGCVTVGCVAVGCVTVGRAIRCGGAALGC